MVLVRQIVEEHRGDITLKSEVIGGTAVIIKRPLLFAASQEMTTG